MYIALQYFASVKMLQFVHVVRRAVNYYVRPFKFRSGLVSSESPRTSLTLQTFCPISNSGVTLVLFIALAVRCLLSCAVCCASCRIKDNCFGRISAFCDDVMCASNNFDSEVSIGNHMLTPYSSWNGLTPLLGMMAAL